jgi:hypothetical protein
MQINVMSTEEGTNMKKNDDDPRNAKDPKEKSRQTELPSRTPNE